MSSHSILDDMEKQKQAFAPVALPVDDTPSKEARAKWEAEFRVQYEAEMRMKFMSSHTAGIAIATAAKTAINAAHSAQMAIQTLSDIRSISKEARLKRLFKDMIIANVAEQCKKSMHPSIFRSTMFPKTDDENYGSIYIDYPHTYLNPNKTGSQNVNESIRHCLNDTKTPSIECLTSLQQLSGALDIIFDRYTSAVEAFTLFQKSILIRHIRTNSSEEPSEYFNIQPTLLIEYLDERDKDIVSRIKEELKAEMKAEFNL